MIVALGLYDLDRGGIPIALDSLPAQEILYLANVAKEWREDAAMNRFLGREDNPDSLRFTCLSDGVYYEVSAVFL